MDIDSKYVADFLSCNTCFSIPVDLIEVYDSHSSPKCEIYDFMFCGFFFKLHRYFPRSDIEYFVLSLYSLVEDDYTVIYISHRS